MANDCLAWLNSSPKATKPIQPAKIVNRRASVAGSNLYAVSDRVQETGFDFLGRLSRPSSNLVSLDLVPADEPNNNPGIQDIHILSAFDPFRRSESIPFALKGRNRSKSIDTMWRPSLHTIFENPQGK